MRLPPALPIGLALDCHFEHCERGRAQFLWPGDGIDRARLQRPLGAMLRAKNDPFGAWPQTGQTRQADGAAIAGEQTQRNLRKADFRGARQHPIVGRERDFEPAAERKTVDRRDRRHREIGQRGDDLAVRADKSLDVFFRPLEDAGEFENIGAHDESILGAGDQDAPDRGRRLDRVERAAQFAEC